MTNKKYGFLLLWLLSGLCLAAQENDSLKNAPQVGLFPKEENTKLYRFGVGGSYRFFGTYTQMETPYLLNDVIDDFTKEKNIFIGDDSQLPNLTLNLSGRPTINTAWGFDLYAFQFIDGQVSQAYSDQVAFAALPTIHEPLAGTRLGGSMGLLLGMNLYGSHSTEYGSFNVGFGGLQWVSLSDLTLGSFKGYNRFTLFERNPWDPIGGTIKERYEKFYSEGNINQDARWGERGFQGLNIAATSLPGGLSAQFLYGKTDISGGFLTIPNTSFGGKISKTFTKGTTLSINSFNNRTYLDSLANDVIGFNVITGQASTTIKDIKLSVEAGLGEYLSPLHDLGWGELASAKIQFPKKVTFIPVELHAFRISPNVINNNAIFWNTAIVEARNNTLPAGSIGSTNVLQPFASAMAPIGAMTNNRQGLNLNTEIDIQRLKLSVALGAAGEIEARSNQITYSHPVNQLTRSRMWRWNFPTNVGPYGRYNVAFRDAYETVNLTDDSLGQAVVAKKFSVMEIQGKYSNKLFYRDFYIFMLNRYSSAQNFWSPITVFNSSAYVRHYSNEIEAYYQVRKRLVLTAYAGYERIIANYDTEVDTESFKPRNQEGIGIGIGCDIDLGKNTGLFIRHRWFQFEDRNFQKDQFSGQETVVELKAYF